MDNKCNWPKCNYPRKRGSPYCWDHRPSEEEGERMFDRRRDDEDETARIEQDTYTHDDEDGVT